MTQSCGTRWRTPPAGPTFARAPPKRGQLSRQVERRLPVLSRSRPLLDERAIEELMTPIPLRYREQILASGGTCLLSRARRPMKLPPD